MSSNLQISRKTKALKTQLAAQKYGSKKRKSRDSSAGFQKKIVCFNYMGPDAPNSFTRSEEAICA